MKATTYSGKLALLLVALHATGLSAQTLTIFGDSLTDSGLRPVGGGFAKWAQQTLRTSEVYPQPPYFDGKYSNGPVWVDYAAQLLGNISYVNWAAGGSTTGAGVSQAAPLPVGFAGYPVAVQVLAPNLFQQLDQNFQYTNNTANATGIYLIFIGNNDYFTIASARKNITADEVVENIEAAMDQLYSAGARRFILVTLPPTAVLPPSLAANTQLVEGFTEHNSLLREVAGEFNASHPNSTVSIFDFGAQVVQIVSNALQYGFTNATGCYPVPNAGVGAPQSGVPVCSDPAKHFIWDTVHPTTAAHAIIGNAFVRQFGYLWGKSISPAPAPSNAASD